MFDELHDGYGWPRKSFITGTSFIPPTPTRLTTEMAVDTLQYREEGRDAFKAGTPQWMCPYAEGTDAYAEWHLGYEDAQFEAYGHKVR